MKAPVIASALFSIAMVSASLSALADDHDNHQYVRHDEWRKGAKIQNEDWNRGERVDYRERHLRAPPRGYEWRQVDGNYVLAAVATGVIASVIVAAATGH
jgi:Ni/Co efflux regulator RcnB